MDDKKKYDSQLKHLRSKYVRFSLDFRPDELEEFKRICKSNTLINIVTTRYSG